MPREGQKAITVSDDLWNELKEKAEKEGLSLPQLIEQYMIQAQSLNQLQWIESPQGIETRINELTPYFYGAILDHRHKERTKKLRLQGEPIENLSHDEARQWENEARNLAQEIAKLVVEKDKETLKQFKLKDEEEKIKYYLKQPYGLRVSTDGRMTPLTEIGKSNAEVIEEQLKEIYNKLESIFSQEGSPLDTMRKNILEIGKLANQWNDLKKYIPYLPENLQNLDEKIGKMLFENGTELKSQ